MIRRIYPTRFGQMHLRSHDGRGVPVVLLHMSPRSGAMWEAFQEKFERPTHAPDRLGSAHQPDQRLASMREVRFVTAQAPGRTDLPIRA